MDTVSTVFLVDDDPNVRDGLKWLIESVELPIEVYESASEFLAAYDPQKLGCLVLDVRMPGMSGLELQEKLQQRNVDLPVIIITGHGDVPLCIRAFEAGAFAFVEKPINDHVLLDHIYKAIELDLQNRRSRKCSPEISACVESLTPREKEVMELIANGRSMKQISSQLGISVQTGSKHRGKILEKMGVDNDVELVRVLLTNNIQPANS